MLWQSRRHRGALVGLAPQIETWNTINKWGLVNFIMSSPPKQTQSPPIENFLATVLWYDVQLGRYWETNDTKKRIKLALTPYTVWLRYWSTFKVWRNGVSQIGRHCALCLFDCWDLTSSAARMRPKKPWPPAKQTGSDFSLVLHIDFNCSMLIGGRYFTSYRVVIDQKSSCDIKMIFLPNS